MGVSPIVGEKTSITTGGTAVEVIPANPNGGFITNPLTSTDQGLSSPEVLYISPVGVATLFGNTITFALQPGQTWNVIPGQETVTTVNAASSGHKFSAVYW